MKVKIAYTVEDDQIPAEIAKFLEKTQNKVYENYKQIKELGENIKHAFDANQLAMYALQIHSVRKELVDADLILSDCQDIVAGLRRLVEKHIEEENEQVSGEEVVLEEEEGKDLE